MATPEWFSRLKRRTAEIIDFENDALERDMVRSQETPSEAQETEEDVARRLRVERERQEEEEIAARLREWNSRNVSKVSRGVYCVLCVLICVTMIALLMFTVTNLPSFGSPDHPINNEVSARYIEKGLQETGAVNIVTGMILDYRAFDTLGESTVLFTAAMVVLFMVVLLAQRKKHPDGDTMALFLLLYGCVQVVLESLRNDSHMLLIHFVRVNQVGALVLAVAVIIRWTVTAVRGKTCTGKKAGLLWALIIISIGLGIGMEFAVDRLGEPLLSYGMMALALVLIAWCGLRFRRMANKV